MRKVAFIWLISWLAVQQMAASVFVYARYDNKQITASELVSYIDSQIKDEDDFCIYISNGEQAYVSRNTNEWDKVKETIRYITYALDFSAETDMNSLNQLFTRLFREEKISVHTHLQGSKDSDWRVVFIMSRNQWEYDSTIIPFRVEEVNELSKRSFVSLQYIEYYVENDYLRFKRHNNRDVQPMFQF